MSLQPTAQAVLTCETDVMRTVVAVQDLQPALPAKICQLQIRPILSSPAQEHELPTATPTGMPIDFIGAPEQAVSSYQHPLILAQT